MLSRQYQPRAGDRVEEEEPPVPNSHRSSIYGGRSGEKGLTLEDLQKLEQLVDDATESRDPAEMRAALRRSLSMNVAPGCESNTYCTGLGAYNAVLNDDVPQGAESEAAVHVPRPSSILRRSARTKIRKSGLIGDGGGHRFAATRKGRMTAAPDHFIPGDEDDYPERRRESDPSDESQRRSDEGEELVGDESVESASHEGRFADAPQHYENRRASDESTEEEGIIFDAYAPQSRSSSVSDDDSVGQSSASTQDISPPRHLTIPTSAPSAQPTWMRDEDRTPTQETISNPLGRFRRPSPGADMERPALPLLPSTQSLQVPPGFHRPISPPPPLLRPSMPNGSSDLPPGMLPPGSSNSASRVQLPSALQSSRSESFSTLPSSKSNEALGLTRSESASSSASRDKDKKGGFFSKKDKKEKEKPGKKEKDGFLGSLFGSKKKTEETSSIANFATAGPAAAAALLGASKSSKIGSHPSSPAPSTTTFSAFARYPIHVERAVYRLSHIKLANARRPLYEQVLISNLMFWYLGVIGRNVAEEKKASADDKKDVETKVSKGTPPKPADSGSAGKPQNESPTKRTSLTKPERAPQRAGREAEIPMRMPQYGMQNAQVDHEVRNVAAQKSNKVSSGIFGAPPGFHSAQTERPAFERSGPERPSYERERPIDRQERPSPLPIDRERPSPQFDRPPPNFSQPPPNFAQPSAFDRAPQRSFSNPPRPAPPPMQRPTSEVYPQQPSAVVHGPPRTSPSPFGPPPPPAAPFPERPRTMSNPNFAPQLMPPGRRIVADGRPPPESLSPHLNGPRQIPSPNPDRSGNASPNRPGGIQPGQIFQYPSGPPMQRPPTQMFRPPPSGFQLGQMIPGQPMFRPPFPGPVGPPRDGQRPPQWESPQRLPMPPPGSRGPPMDPRYQPSPYPPNGFARPPGPPPGSFGQTEYRRPQPVPPGPPFPHHR